MPLLLILGGSTLLGMGALAFKSATDDGRAIVEDTGPDLVTLGAAALGLYVAFQVVSKGRL